MLYTTFSPVVLFVNETRNILYIFLFYFRFRRALLYVLGFGESSRVSMSKNPVISGSH